MSRSGVKSEHASIMDKFVSASGIGAFDSYIHFAVMKGRQYDKQDRLRLMLVGRSTNGWLSMSRGLDSKSSGGGWKIFFLDRNHTSFDWIHNVQSKSGVFANGERVQPWQI